MIYLTIAQELLTTWRGCDRRGCRGHLGCDKRRLPAGTCGRRGDTHGDPCLGTVRPYRRAVTRLWEYIMKCCVQSWLGSGSVLVLAAAVVLSGCGGGADVPGTHGPISPPTVSGIDKAPNIEYGNSVTTAHFIFPDNGIITGAINFAGDVDMFHLDAAAGATYGLQFLGIPVTPPDASDPFQVIVTILEADGVDIHPSTIDIPIPVKRDDGHFRVMFTADTNGPIYVRLIHERGTSGTGNYAFNLASSQLAIVDEFDVFETNTTTFTVVDDDGVLLLSPTLVRATFKFIDMNLNTNDLLRVPNMTFRFDVFELATGFPPIYIGNEDPETPSVHFHYGFPNNNPPATHNNATDPTSDFIIPVDASEHSIAFDITPPPGVRNFRLDVPPEIVHMITGQPWFYDVHFTTETEVLNEPVLSGRANGTLNFFETTLLLSGVNVVPPVPTSNLLLLKYNTAFQSFMIEFERGPTFPSPDTDLIGRPIHVHRGAPGFNGDILIDLGVVPAPKADLTFETVPWIKNVVKDLTNTEAFLLRQATYTTGWYVDVHTPGFPDGEIRAEGFLGIATDPRALAPAPN